jgi:outer membrane immunogenic protein
LAYEAGGVKMKKFLLTSVAFIALAAGTPAGAADMAVRAVAPPPPPAPVYNSWTGVYVGGGWGYGMYNLDTAVTPVGIGVSNQTLGGRGWLGTVTLGGDYQLNNWLVLGGFADYDLADIKSNNQSPSLINPFGTIRETSAWAVGARAGWVVNPTFMPYFNAGYTRARFTDSAATLPSHWYNGWFIGSGVETRLSGFLGILGPGWFWRNEYRFAEYRNTTFSNNPILSSVSARPFVQTVRSEITYKFNWGN